MQINGDPSHGVLIFWNRETGGGGMQQMSHGRPHMRRGAKVLIFGWHPVQKCLLPVGARRRASSERSFCRSQLSTRTFVALIRLWSWSAANSVPRRKAATLGKECSSGAFTAARTTACVATCRPTRRLRSNSLHRAAPQGLTRKLIDSGLRPIFHSCDGPSSCSTGFSCPPLLSTQASERLHAVGKHVGRGFDCAQSLYWGEACHV